MKRIIALLLSLLMVVTGCGQVQNQANTENLSSSMPEAIDQVVEFLEWENIELQYSSLDDPELLAHIEDLVYRDTIVSLNSEAYFVENVTAIYISKEYLDELTYNSQSNVYFGYSLAELDEIFEGKKYIFNLSEGGTTTVEELLEIKDVSTEKMFKNVAIGTGVILVCVTVSVVSAGASAPAVSMIFAASATTASGFAVSSAAFGGISAGAVRGIQTGDFNEVVQAAAMEASEGFKWGAIIGAVIGGGTEAFLLKSATKSGLTMDDAARIQVDSDLPIDIISQMHSLDEYLVYKESGLYPMMVKGRTALVQKIDLTYVSELSDKKVTNLVRMQKGYPPLDPVSGKAYELHHIGQKKDAMLAILTQDQHRGKGVFAKLHKIWKDSDVPRGTEWNKTVSEFWKDLGNQYAKGGI